MADEAYPYAFIVAVEDGGYGSEVCIPILSKVLTACKTYAEMLLWKNNINYELCDTTCVLNSNYTVGIPIYIERQLAVWYIGRVTHSFNSGSGCTTSLTLTYKRTPICLKKDLQKYLNDNLGWGKLNQVEYDYIKKYEKLLTWGTLYVAPMPIAETSEVAETTGTIQGNQVVTGTRRIVIGKGELYDRGTQFVWTPIPNALYLLTLELQNQIDIINTTNSNDIKTIRNTTIKKDKKLSKKAEEYKKLTEERLNYERLWLHEKQRLINENKPQEILNFSEWLERYKQSKLRKAQVKQMREQKIKEAEDAIPIQTQAKIVLKEIESFYEDFGYENDIVYKLFSLYDRIKDDWSSTTEEEQRKKNLSQKVNEKLYK